VKLEVAVMEKNAVRQEAAYETTTSEANNGGEIIAVREACRFLNVHRNTLYKLIREGEIPAFRLMRGSRWRFRKNELEEWLENRQAKREL